MVSGVLGDGRDNRRPGFATHDRAIWAHTRRLERLHDHYRIRVGLHHRLLVYWRPGEALTILDLIPREDLESWIQRHA